MNKEIVLPNYNHSILNVISSILKYYNVQTKHSGLKSLDEILNKKYSNVILIILDGMGEHILNNISKEGYFNKHKVDCITSVYPSTTTAALTTYYSGKPPIETGYIAWSQYFKEYGRNVDMLSHQESYLHEDISKAKINVFDTIMKYESVFEQIEKASPNVKAYEITPTYSDKRAKRSIRADSISEIVDEIKMLCKVPEEKFILAYSDNPDGIIHDYGTDSEEAKEFILDIKAKIEKNINCNIEMQVIDRKNIEKRILYHWSKMYSSGIKKGQDYNSLNKNIVILISNYELEHLKEIKKYLTKWYIMEKDYTDIILTDVFEICIIELPKFKKYMENTDSERLDSWINFIKNPEVSMKKEEKALKKAREVLEEISQDERERRLAELREITIMDHKAIEEAGYDKGLKQGSKNEKISIAKKMKKRGTDIKDIIEITGLTSDEINKLN